MEKTKIILDIDGLIADFFGYLKKIAKERYRKKIAKGTYSVLDNFQREWEEIIKDDDFWLNMPTLNEAEKKLKIIPEAYLTARPTTKKITQQWLDKWGFPKAKIILVNHYEDKGQVMVDRFRNSILIDDNVPTIQNLLKRGLFGILFKADHQKEYGKHNLPTISTIEEVNNIGTAYNLKLKGFLP